MSAISPRLSGNIAADASILLELAHATALGQRLRGEIRRGRLSLLVTRVTLTEVFYVLCRQLGREVAGAKVAALVESGVCSLAEPADVAMTAGGVKCERALPLADCYVLALAQLTGGTALFARAERDLQEAMRKRRFEMPVRYLADVFR